MNQIEPLIAIQIKMQVKIKEVKISCVHHER